MPANGTNSFVPPPSGAYECLKAAAKDCKMQINAAQMDGISLSYDPAAKVYQKVFEQLSEKSRGKKRQVDNEEFAPSVSKKSKTSKTSIFQIVLMPSTSKVDAGICLMLDEKMCISLFTSGLMHILPLRENISNEELISELSAPFHPIAEFACLLEAGDLAPWQLLSKSIRRKGQTPLLLAFNELPRNISYQDLMLYTSLLFLVSAISAANQQFDSLATPVQAYKPLSKALFISLPQGEIEIPFGPSLYGGSDLDSESTADIEMAHMKDTPLPMASLSDNETLPLASSQVSPGRFVYFIYIFEHIYYAVKENETLWPFKTTAPYAGLVQASELFSYSICQCHKCDIDWPFERLLDFFDMYISPKLQFILELYSVIPIANEESSRLFEENFRLGSHGLSPIIKWFQHINNLITAKPQILSTAHHEPLPATIEHDIQLDLDEHYPSKFREVLTLRYGYKLQGGANACIDPTKLLTGPFRLHGLLDSYIYPFFDSFPLDHISYFELHMIFRDFCEQAHNMIQALTRVDVTSAPSTPLKPMSQVNTALQGEGFEGKTGIGPKER
ncbi:hypothetical protein K439DRAFT_1610334 [Ramaria rubella]|nr:hypothetical protein K439DRAFT_1610334 [Ramaria rubella]